MAFWLTFLAAALAQPAAGLYVVVEKDGQKGVATASGIEVVPVRFDEVNYLGFGLFRVRKDSLYGLYAGAGKELLPPLFPTLYLDAQDLVRYKNVEGKTGMLDRMGKTVAPCEYDSIAAFADGVALAGQRHKKSYKWGYLSRTGKLIWPCEFDERDLRSFGSGLAPVRLTENW
ncbi:MAG: WG repeat-containing protein, partial [Bacteroidia bacterium]|nr:WG repeat-containing protein [Bacteroidia bacterium]